MENSSVEFAIKIIKIDDETNHVTFTRKYVIFDFYKIYYFFIKTNISKKKN